MSVVNVVRRKVEVSASGCSLIQKNPTECGVFECDREASITTRPWPTRGGGGAPFFMGPKIFFF